MRLRVETTVERPPAVVFDFIARDHWRNHPRWDPNVLQMTPLQPGPIGVGSRARVRRKRGSGDEVLEVIAFEPDTRWTSRSQIGPISLEMTALIDPAGRAASRLRLLADNRARGAVRYAVPVFAPLIRRQMRASLKRIKEMVETESPSP